MGGTANRSSADILDSIKTFKFERWQDDTVLAGSFMSESEGKLPCIALDAVRDGAALSGGDDSGENLIAGLMAFSSHADLLFVGQKRLQPLSHLYVLRLVD